MRPSAADGAEEGTERRSPSNRAWAAAVRPGARVLPEHARAHNRVLVLQALYRAAGLSRADLAREVGLTRVTISDLVADLIAEGLVLELGIRNDARPGKPATLLDINRTGFAIVGIDLSYDSIFRGALMDLDGTVLHREQIDVAGVSGDSAVDAVTELLDRLVARATVPVLGVQTPTRSAASSRWPFPSTPATPTTSPSAMSRSRSCKGRPPGGVPETPRIATRVRPALTLAAGSSAATGASIASPTIRRTSSASLTEGGSSISATLSPETSAPRFGVRGRRETIESSL